MGDKSESWRCKHEEDNENLFCPPEGCPKDYGCARDHGWKPGMPSPRECMGLKPLPVTDKHTTKASAIMDEACLGEPFVSNGVVAALRASIESALRSAAAEEREECAVIDIGGVIWSEVRSGTQRYRERLIEAFDANSYERESSLLDDIARKITESLEPKIASSIRSRGIPND